MARGIFVTLLLLSYESVAYLYVRDEWLPNIRHNLILGRKKPNDVVLYRRTIYRFNWNPLANTDIDVKFPEKKRQGLDPLITQIDAIDLDSYDTGGFVSIIKGGVGRRYVTIRFTSQNGRGLKFRLTIYGHK